jgi:hypothetical protein
VNGSLCPLMTQSGHPLCRRITQGCLRPWILGEVRKLVDRNDFQIKRLEALHARRNDLICLLDAGCVENRKEAWFESVCADPFDD